MNQRTDQQRVERERDDTPADGTAFKREGPTSADADTGDTVEEMNRAAEDALLKNVRPDEAID